MKFLFISSDFPNSEKSSNIYTDLAEALNEAGHSVKVAVTEERKNISKTKLNKERNIDVLRVKTGNMYEVGFYEKAITFITISNILIRNIKKYFKDEKFDFVITSTPPITFNKVVKWAMNYYNCKSYLMLKDIFPQNGVDLGLYKKNGLIYKYFRKKEKDLYKFSTYIGCMSKENINYIIKHNSYLDKNKIELFPNTVKIKNRIDETENQRKKIRKKYNIGLDDVVAVFGGNFGIPQGLNFFMKIMNEYKNNKKVKFLLIGRGTEKNKVFKYISDNNIKNVIKMDYISRDYYEKLLSTCDIGLIFLDNRFTIPNIPSKTLSYLECGLPIMAATDTNTDYGKILMDNNFGFWVESGNLKEYKKKFDKLVNNKDLRIEMGVNGRKYFEENCDVRKSVNILEEKGDLCVKE